MLLIIFAILNMLIIRYFGVRKIVAKIGIASAPDWRNFAFVWG